MHYILMWRSAATNDRLTSNNIILSKPRLYLNWVYFCRDFVAVQIKDAGNKMAHHGTAHVALLTINLLNMPFNALICSGCIAAAVITVSI